jgi:hypothetical protein
MIPLDEQKQKPQLASKEEQLKPCKLVKHSERSSNILERERDMLLTGQSEQEIKTLT